MNEVIRGKGETEREGGGGGDGGGGRRGGPESGSAPERERLDAALGSYQRKSQRGTKNLKNTTFHLILASLTPSSNFKGVRTSKSVSYFLSNHQPAAPGDNIHTKEPKKLPSVCLRHVRQARQSPATHLQSVLQVNQWVEAVERTFTRTKPKTKIRFARTCV